MCACNLLIVNSSIIMCLVLVCNEDCIAEQNYEIIRKLFCSYLKSKSPSCGANASIEGLNQSDQTLSVNILYRWRTLEDISSGRSLY